MLLTISEERAILMQKKMVLIFISPMIYILYFAMHNAHPRFCAIIYGLLFFIFPLKFWAKSVLYTGKNTVHGFISGLSVTLIYVSIFMPIPYYFA